MRRNNPSQITGRHGPGGDWPGVGGDWLNDFGRREPWAAHFARSGNFPKQPRNRSDTPMGPWPGELVIASVVITVAITRTKTIMIIIE